uniref:Uncharacterized protein n=1 Tax=Anguilla anguilla TaxID=7936 RepID=A0A0E9UYQ3_ANGAN
MLGGRRTVQPRVHERQVNVVHVRHHKYFLELALQLPLDPLSDVAEGHLPLTQHGPHSQVQSRWNTETVPYSVSRGRGILTARVPESSCTSTVRRSGVLDTSSIFF